MPRLYQSKTPQQLIKDGSVMTYKEYLEACSRQYHIRKDLKEYGIQPKNFSGVKFEELMAAINELKEATNVV